MEDIKASLAMYFFMIERHIDDEDETDPRCRSTKTQVNPDSALKRPKTPPE